MNTISRLLEGLVPEHVVSFEGTSQYTEGGTSTCGLAALNAVRIILGREQKGISGAALLQQIASKDIIDEIIAICARWSSQLHLEVDDVSTLPLFDHTLALSFSEYNPAEPQKFTALLRRLEEAGSASKAAPPSRVSSAVVITRPPEILTVFHIPTHSPKRPSIFIVFDSHPRPAKGTKGASFIFFPTLEATSQYISSLLQVDPSLLAGLGGMQWQAQLLGHYSGHVYLARNNYNVDDNPMWPIYDANMDVLELKSRLADAEDRIRTLNADNTSLHNRLTEMKGIRSQRRSPASVERVTQAYDPLSSQTRDPSHRNSPPPVAGPSAHFEGSMRETRQSSSTINGGQHGQSPSSRERERVDALLAARLHRDQEKELASLELARRTQETLDVEDSELQRQMRQLQEIAQVLFECNICLNKHSEDSVTRIDGCRHELCRGCMKDFVTSKLEEHRYPIVCPFCQTDTVTKDPGVITAGLVEQLGLTESQYSVWIELELSQFSIVLDCPKCRQSTFVDLADHTDMELIRCPLPNCNHVWCKSCQRHVETGTQHSCDGSLELDDLMKTQGWRYCPGCKTPTEKQSGCNHMTCPARGCNTHFCYVCGESIVRSVRPGDIQPALNSHYRRCHLFEDILDRNAV